MLCLSVKTLQTIKIGSNFSKFFYLFWKSGSVFHLQRPTVQAQVVGWKQSLVLEKFCLRLRWGVLNKVVVSRGKTRTWARFFYRGERRQASSVTTVTGKAKKATRILACGSKEQSIGKIKERQQHSSLSLTLYFPRFFLFSSSSSINTFYTHRSALRVLKILQRAKIVIIKDFHIALKLFLYIIGKFVKTSVKFNLKMHSFFHKIKFSKIFFKTVCDIITLSLAFTRSTQVHKLSVVCKNVEPGENCFR